MKIEKIELTNIYGHEQATLDLSGVRAAVMIGHNGAGKSSMIDGALFALFGRAAVRGGALANVVRQGAQVGTARVEFELERQRWRVTRTYSTKTKAGASTIAIEQLVGGEWQGAADAGAMRDVDAQIVALLGVDLRAFTLATVMRQGDSAAFTSLSPGDKLKALSALVGADKLRAAAEAAGTELTFAKREIEASAREVEEAQRLASDAAEAATAAASLRAAADAAARAAADAAARLESLNSEGSAYKRQVEGAAWQIEDLERQLASLEEDAGRCAKLEARASEQRERIEAIVAQRDALPVVAGEQADDTVAHYEEQVATLNEHCGRYVGTQQEIKMCEGYLATEARRFAAAAVYVDRIDAARAELSEIDKALTTAADLRERIAKLDEQIEAADATQQRALSRLRAQADALKGRPDECRWDGCGLIQGALLAKSDLATLERQDPAALPREEREALRAKLSEIMRGLGSTDEASARAAALEARLKADEAALVEARRVEDARARLDRLRADLGDDPRDARDAAVMYLRTAQRQRDDRRRVEQQRATIGAALKREVEALETIEADLRELGDKLKIHDLTGHRQILEGYKTTRDEAEARRQAVKERWASAKVEAEETARAAAAAADAAARAEGRAAGLASATERASLSSARLEGAKREALELSLTRDFLRAAPQMVVATAIPQIEAAANEILRDVAPGVALRIERQRETKAGDARDEITITVQTSAGARDLDTFSGGERFRLDVALRLALARIAAGRSGTARPLQTLVVDEGWGSLDPDGVQALKDTFARLRERFERILVVTHVPDVVDLFGQVVEVDRPGEGATTITIY